MKITKKYEITVEFEKRPGEIDYTYEEIVKYADSFKDKILKYKYNKNESIFVEIVNCEEIL